MALNKKSTAMGSGLKTFLGLSLLTGGFVGVLVTILGFFGSTSWFFDVLANFRFQLAVGLLVMGALYLIGYGRTTGILFMIVGAVNAFLVAPLYLNSPADAASTESVRLVSFNVGAGRADPQELIDWVEEGDADFVFLLESTDEWAEAIPIEGTDYSLSNAIPDDRAYGISLFGKSASDVEQLRLGFTRDPVLRVVTTIDDQQVAVYAVHPRPPDSQRTTEARDALFRDLAQLVSGETMPVIVIGDFNATPWSYAFRDFTSDTGLINSQLGYGLSATWPTTLVSLVPLDHMLHSDSLTTIARDVGPDLGSDHRPLTVEVSIAAG